jgi:hypothetical protein
MVGDRSAGLGQEVLDKNTWEEICRRERLKTRICRSLMEVIQLTGAAYRKFSRAVYVSSGNKSDLSRLNLWHQPLAFFPSSDVLRQCHGGPCGLFAAIQAHIIFAKMNSEGSIFDLRTELLVAVLDIFARISPIFVFCTDVNASKSVCTFRQTQSRDEALCFLLDSDYLNNSHACLLLTVSFIFAYGGLTALRLPSVPFIEGPQWTTVSLTWLLLTGSVSDQSLAAVEAHGYSGSARTEIGFRVLEASNPRLIGTWLNPESTLFVCLTKTHFFTVRVTSGDILVIYDNLNPKSPRATTKAEFKWW